MNATELCKFCDGSGISRYYMDAPVKCIKCGGTGEQRFVNELKTLRAVAEQTQKLMALKSTAKRHRPPTKISVHASGGCGVSTSTPMEGQ